MRGERGREIESGARGGEARVPPQRRSDGVSTEDLFAFAEVSMEHVSAEEEGRKGGMGGGGGGAMES